MPWIPNTQIGRSGPDESYVFYAADYGANFNGLTGGTFDNTAAINAALAAASAFVPPQATDLHGAIVQLPSGIGRITGKLTVTNGIWLRGIGTGATVLYGTNWGANADPAIYLDSTNQAAMVSDLALVMNSGMSTSYGIQVAGGLAWGPTQLGGITTKIQRVLVYVQATGIVLAGVENRLQDCYVRSVSGWGFEITGSDVFIDNCTADTCDLGGFLMQTSNTKVSNSKAFGCGASGWVINGQRNMLSSCEAQDNAESGFIAVQSDNVLAGCVADSNSVSPSNPGNSDQLTGFVINGSCAQGCSALNRTGSTQKYGFKTTKPQTTDPLVSGTSNLPGTAHVHPDSVGSITVNALLGTQSVTYATPITPDPYLGGTVLVGTLTGDITVNAVATAGLFSGMRVGFQFTQDGTGRTVTFNSQYKTSAAIPTTPSSVTRIQFEWDGSFFRETGRATT
jgi:hypothetical protein